MASPNIYTFATLMKRLEAVTLRIEDIAAIYESPGGGALPTIAEVNPIQPLNPSESTKSTGLVPSCVASPLAPRCIGENLEVPRAIEEFDHFLHSSIGRYVQLSSELGNPVIADQAARVLDAFRAQREILVVSTKIARPDAARFQELLQPMTACAAEVVEIKECYSSSNDDRAYYNHLSAVADGIGLLGWVGIEMRPYMHVGQYLGSAQYFGNKVLKEFRGKNPKHVEWIQSFYQIFRDLSDLIKEHFATGISWNVHSQHPSVAC